MDLFVSVHDRIRDLDIQLSMATVRTYKEADIIDLDGTSHICILYILNNGLRFEEEFDTTSDRDDKMATLDEYLA